MDEKVTMEIANEKLEEAIALYTKERTKENLHMVLNLLRPARLLVPAMLKAPNQPVPCFLKSNNGEQFMVVYTSKAQLPKEPKSQGLVLMTFPACNSIVVKPELKLTGMAINPFTQNLVLRTELIEKLHEADQKAAQQPRQIKMTPAQFDVFMKKQVEFGIMPRRLFAEGAGFVEKLCDEKETFVDEIFVDAYKEPKLYAYNEDDYSVMALDIAEDLTMVRIDLPEKGILPSLCYRIYVTFNPLTQKAGYYTIEMGKDKKTRVMAQMLENGQRAELGEAPVEGAELQTIMDLARGVGVQVTS